MATMVTMPRLSPTMEEGVLRKWLKKPGEKINPGDVIAEVETDKANMDFPYEDEGTLLKYLVGEGDTVKLGAPVAVVGEPGEDAEAVAATQQKPAAPAKAPEAAAPAPIEREATQKIVRPVAAPAPAIAPAPGGRPKASPLARKLARERGVDLAAVAGSGPRGRIVARDLVIAPPPPAAAPVETRAPVEAIGEQTIPITPMRRTIARRLVEAKSTVPHFYVTMDADAEALVAFHAQLRSAAGEDGVRVSLNDLVIKALAVALGRLPAANASWSDTGIVRHGRVDIGVAVSIEDGLVTPVVRAADQKTVGAIARETRDLIERARARKLRAEEFTGGTFSVSNMGMYGVREFAAIINPPESGILAVGAVEKRAVVAPDDTIVARRRMTLTLSCDHRIIDGTLGAKLLGEIRKAIEQPILLSL